jgi:hypothetical protein
MFMFELVPPLPEGLPGAGFASALLETDPQDALPPMSTSAKIEHVVKELER